MPRSTKTKKIKRGFPTLTTAQAAVYRFLQRRGALTDQELVALYPTDLAAVLDAVQTPSGLRTRRSELVRKGYVVARGTRKSTTGRTVTRWRAL